MSDKSLSLRHLRFVQEYLRDGNATQAYIRAGYSPRHAQSCASRLLAQPPIEAALAAGRQRLAEALDVTVERMAQEYARIAFANVRDFIEVEEDGRLRIDLTKASQTQCAGLVEVSVTNHGKQSQTVRLKLGKLQALNGLARRLDLFTVKPQPGLSPKPGLSPEERESLEQRLGLAEASFANALQNGSRLKQELSDAKMTLAMAEVKLKAAGVAMPTWPAGRSMQQAAEARTEPPPQEPPSPQEPAREAEAEPRSARPDARTPPASEPSCDLRQALQRALGAPKQPARWVIPMRDTPEFAEVLSKLRRGTLEPAKARQMIQAGYGLDPERGAPWQMERYEPDWG